MAATPLLLLHIALCATLLLFTSGTSFPKNMEPISITKLDDVPNSVFTGGDVTADHLRYVQQIKMMKIAGKMFFTITGRENLYIIKPEDFSPEGDTKMTYHQVFTWKSDKKAKRLCILKGQSEENCENYIRVVEPMDENGNKLLVCATNSYQPLCRYIRATMNQNELVLTTEDEPFSGAEKCAFGPDQTGVSLYTDNSLYSATVTDFSGRSYTITRNLGSAKQLRTPKFDSKFLNEPQFVEMVDDGERVLIFMNEMFSTEDGDLRMMAYVGQVCKNDVGGQHVLVRQWTKFEKTRLNCSMNGFYFDQLQDVSEPVDVHVGAGSSNNTVKMIYATFTTPNNAVPGSAVCAFSLDAIHNSLLGRFRKNENDGDPKTKAPTGTRHPGNCPGAPYTESELLFLKSHPLLEDQSRGTVLTTHVGESWTSLAVDSNAGPNKNWTVYFVGTEEGQLLRYLAPTSGSKTSTLLRRQDVFDANRCSGNSTDEENKKVTNIFADPERDQILVSFKHCVISVPLRSCSIYRCKESCFASADPYCGWNGSECVAYTTPSVNVEQYISSNLLHLTTNIESLCPTEKTFKSVEAGLQLEGKTDVEPTTANKDTAPSDGEQNVIRRVSNNTNCTHGIGKAGSGGVYYQPQSIGNWFENGYVQWYIVPAVISGAALVFFFIGFCSGRLCCPKQLDAEKQDEMINASKASIAMSACKKAQSFIASISPKRKRKHSGKASSVNHSQSNLADQQEEPLVGDSKHDECVKSRAHDTISRSQYAPSMARSSRMSSTSQITMTESLASYDPKRRNSSQPTMSLVSIPRDPVYATAPRPRNYSGNRTSDPSEYSNASTLRVDKMNNRVHSRHSTPVLQVTTPTSSTGEKFTFDCLVENTESILQDVQDVIDVQQRRSQEMEAVPEESIEARERHDSSDSGKGSSPRNSMQNEDERQNKISTLRRPEALPFVNNRGRTRLNSEPTSPTLSNPPLPPPSNHKPVGRATSMRADHMPHQYRRKRSESFTAQSHPSTPSGTSSPHRPQEISNGYQQVQAPHNMYSTLPLKPNVNGSRRQQQQQQPQDQFNRQMPYDTYSPHRCPYGQRENGVHPAMQMPDKYSSLPLRSHAHRSNKKQFVQHPPPQVNRHSSSNGTDTMQPHYHKQMSSPANFDQRLKYVQTPTVPMNIKPPHAV